MLGLYPGMFTFNYSVYITGDEFMQRIHARHLYIGTTAEKATTSPPKEAIGVEFYQTDDDTKWYWDGEDWIAYESGVIIEVDVTYNANFGDATPAIIWNVPANRVLDIIDVMVTEVWNGTGANIRIGVTGELDKYYAASDTELDKLAAYQKDFCEDGPIELLLSIVPGSGATTGKVCIQVTTTRS
jgi:hypothetical protein